MEIKVVKDIEPIQGECLVSQLNSTPQLSSDLDSIPRWIDEKQISVIVPFRKSSVLCQVDNEARISLEKSYSNCIVEASRNKLKSILFHPLGLDLYWDSVQSSAAARKAILETSELVADDFLVIFSVDEEDFEIWDGVMRF